MFCCGRRCRLGVHAAAVTDFLRPLCCGCSTAAPPRKMDGSQRCASCVPSSPCQSLHACRSDMRPNVHQCSVAGDGLEDSRNAWSDVGGSCPPFTREETAQRKLPELRASAPTGACTRLRQPCAAPRGWRELGPALCGGGRPQSRPMFLQLHMPVPSRQPGARPAAPGAAERADERHISRDLPASKGQWQPEVQVAEEDVGRDPGARFPANARRSGFQGASSTGQRAGCGARGSGRLGQWEAQAEERHPGA